MPINGRIVLLTESCKKTAPGAFQRGACASTWVEPTRMVRPAHTPQINRSRENLMVLNAECQIPARPA